ncbi:MAG: DUF3857 domain-containing protein [Bacteroidetes bacterium]|nr:DUF3857 domain-containing protein [Bacteroidota bacterium]
MTPLKNTLSALLLLLVATNASAQKSISYTRQNIPEALIVNANAVVRLSETNITMHSYKDMTVKSKRIVTILNDQGDRYQEAYIGYDPYVDIEFLEASIYDKNGQFVKKIKRKEFRDQSYGDGVSIYNDDRILFLSYTPTAYPYTLVFDSEYRTSTTAFIEAWYPLGGMYVSTQKSSYSINFEQPLPHRIKKSNLENNPIKDLSTPQSVQFEAENIAAVKPEGFAPTFTEMAPMVRVALNKFHLKGVDGQGDTWEDFGKWMYDDLLMASNDLPEASKVKIKTLVAGKSKMEAAKLVYEYVQENTRYVSVQIGVGGWKPMKASEVDRLGYGDCKALTNYTKSLMDAAGVASYYSVVYAGANSKKDIDEDFVAMQGNHVILAIPDEDDKMVWIDCTSQVHPFGFVGDFTDDRKVLLVKPEGGEIVKTVRYDPKDNYQKTEAEYRLNPDGSMTGLVEIQTRGTQYNDRFTLTQRTELEKESHYKEFWNYLNGLQINSIALENNKESVVFTEKVDVGCDSYATNVNGELIFCPNGFNQITSIPNRYRDRTMPLKLRRGYHDEDVFRIHLPEGYEIGSLPEGVSLINPFGKYEFELTQNPDGTLTYRREILRKEGVFPKEDYEAYRNFMKDVSRYDAAKIVLKKKRS